MAFLLAIVDGSGTSTLLAAVSVFCILKQM